MAISVTVSLVGTTSPRQVQIDVGGTSPGDIVSIVGSLGTFSWSVRGAADIVATGSQVLRRDNLAPVNVAFTYIVTVNAVQYESSEITVTYGANYVLTGLDGLDSVDFTWLDNDAPVDIDFNQHFTRVPGRDTDVMRYAEGGVESGEYLVQTVKSDTLVLRTILRKGAPVVLRTNGSIRDIPPVSIVGITSAHRELRRKGGNSSDRNWLLGWRDASDPRATVPVTAWTFADMNAVITAEGGTFADLNSYITAMGGTFADINAWDWESEA